MHAPRDMQSKSEGLQFMGFSDDKTMIIRRDVFDIMEQGGVRDNWFEHKFDMLIKICEDLSLYFDSQKDLCRYFYNVYQKDDHPKWIMNQFNEIELVFNLFEFHLKDEYGFIDRDIANLFDYVMNYYEIDINSNCICDDCNPPINGDSSDSDSDSDYFNPQNEHCIS